MRLKNPAIFTLALLLSVGNIGIARAQIIDTEAKDNKTLNAAAVEQMSDNAPIELTGTIGEVRDNEFDLQFQGETITVTLDKMGWSADEAVQILRINTLVIVNGQIDKDPLDQRRIIAHSLRFSDTKIYGPAP